MRPAMYHLSIRVAQADAVFASALQRSAEPTAGQVRRAVAETVRAFGSRGCAARVAQEFGDHPESAAARMRWARTVADQAFGTRRAPIAGEVPGATWAPGTAGVRGTAGALNKAEALGGAGALGRTGAPSAREAQPGRARSLARYPVAAGGRAA